jgi:hypothetical protein
MVSHFTSKHLRLLFPKLAKFYFQSWQNFISKVGKILFPKLVNTLENHRHDTRRYKLHEVDYQPSTFNYELRKWNEDTLNLQL